VAGGGGRLCRAGWRALSPWGGCVGDAAVRCVFCAVIFPTSGCELLPTGLTSGHSTGMCMTNPRVAGPGSTLCCPKPCGTRWPPPSTVSCAATRSSRSAPIRVSESEPKYFYMGQALHAPTVADQPPAPQREGGWGVWGQLVLELTRKRERTSCPALTSTVLLDRPMRAPLCLRLHVGCGIAKRHALLGFWRTKNLRHARSARKRCTTPHCDHALLPRNIHLSYAPHTLA
jgi:hypothetical protein